MSTCYDLPSSSTKPGYNETTYIEFQIILLLKLHTNILFGTWLPRRYICYFCSSVYISSITNQATRHSSWHNHSMQKTTKQIKKADMAEPIKYDLHTEHYSDPKKTRLAHGDSMKISVTLKRCLLIELAQWFSQRYIAPEGCPEFNGYNT